MDSLSAAIPPPPSMEARDGMDAVQRRFARLAAPREPRTLPLPGPLPATLFTMADPGVHDADPAVHDGPIWLFTLRRSPCSPSTEIRTRQRALALILAGEGEIELRHLPGGGSAASSGRAADLLGVGFALDDLERDLIFAALERAGGNKTEAAKLLGVTRRRLYSLLASHAEGPGGA